MAPHRASDPTLLFVYGTLRPALATGAIRELIAPFAVLGPATVRGILYDLGAYPAFIHGDGLVHGDLLTIAAAGDLAAVDDYEECSGPRPLYRREPVTARQPDGSAVAAWTYVYCRDLAGAPRVPGGDYRAHRATASGRA